MNKGEEEEGHTRTDLGGGLDKRTGRDGNSIQSPRISEGGGGGVEVTNYVSSGVVDCRCHVTCQGREVPCLDFSRHLCTYI